MSNILGRKPFFFLWKRRSPEFTEVDRLLKESKGNMSVAKRYLATLSEEKQAKVVAELLESLLEWPLVREELSDPGFSLD